MDAASRRRQSDCDGRRRRASRVSKLQHWLIRLPGDEVALKVIGRLVLKEPAHCRRYKVKVYIHSSIYCSVDVHVIVHFAVLQILKLHRAVQGGVKFKNVLK